MKKEIVLIAISTFISGCVGVSTYTTKEFYHPPQNVLIDKYRNQYGFIFQENHTPGVKEKKEGDRWYKDGPYTKEEIVRLWGEPDEVYNEGSCEVMSYRDGRSWEGILVWAVLPVPLLVPTGVNYNKFYLKNGENIGATQQWSDTGYLFGYFFGDVRAGRNTDTSPYSMPNDLCR